jgi:hypothetical protein
VLSKDLTILYGHSYVQWNTLRRWFEDMDKITDLEIKIPRGPPRQIPLGSPPDMMDSETRLNVIKELLTVRENRQIDNHHLLDGILNMFCGNQCTEPKDAVYGLLGLMTWEQRDALGADYSKSVEQIYEDVILLAIREQARLYWFSPTPRDINFKRFEIFLENLYWRLGLTEDVSIHTRKVNVDTRPTIAEVWQTEMRKCYEASEQTMDTMWRYKKFEEELAKGGFGCGHLTLPNTAASIGRWVHETRFKDFYSYLSSKSWLRLNGPHPLQPVLHRR